FRWMSRVLFLMWAMLDIVAGCVFLVQFMQFVIVHTGCLRSVSCSSLVVRSKGYDGVLVSVRMVLFLYFMMTSSLFPPVSLWRTLQNLTDKLKDLPSSRITMDGWKEMGLCLIFNIMLEK
ncbi:hypothetical protein L9F63_000934, partial [Diploptera punctata]